MTPSGPTVVIAVGAGVDGAGSNGLGAAGVAVDVGTGVEATGLAATVSVTVAVTVAVLVLVLGLLVTVLVVVMVFVDVLTGGGLAESSPPPAHPASTMTAAAMTPHFSFMDRGSPRQGARARTV